MKRLIILLCSAVIVGALPVLGLTSPNGINYDVEENGLYFLFKKKDAYGAPDRYFLVDADYTEHLLVPDVVNGCPVVEVTNFKARTDIEKVTLGKNVTNVTFFDCEYITEFNFGEAKNVRGNLYDLNAVESLVFPEGSDIYTQGCENLKSVEYRINSTVCCSNCPTLTSVKYEEGSVEIGSITNCTALKEVYIPASVEKSPCFDGCKSLENVTFGEGSNLLYIGGNAFRNTNIKKFVCPSQVQYLGEGAFAGSPLEELTLSEKFNGSSKVEFSDGTYMTLSYQRNLGNVIGQTKVLKRINYINLDQLIKFPPYLVEIYWGDRPDVELYVGGELLTEFTVPTSMTDASGIFRYTSGLKKVVIPNSTGSMNLYEAFRGIKTLEAVEIGAGAPNLDWAFIDCINLKSVTVSPKNRTKTLRYAFPGCISLENVGFPEVTTLADDCFKGCTSLKSINFPKVEGELGGFGGCTSLEEIDFPLVTSIPYMGFEGCSKLRRVNTPLVSEIPDRAFKDCESLCDITFGKLTGIGENAFLNCASLRHIDLSAVTGISHNAFSGAGIEELITSDACSYFGKQENCLDLKTVSVYGGGSLYNCPRLERADFYGDGDVVINKCMSETEGSIYVHDDKRVVEVCDISTLKRLQIEGVCELCIQHASPKEFGVRSLEQFFSCTSRNAAFTPGNQASAPIDLYIDDKLVTEIEIPAGTTIRPRFMQWFNLSKVVFGEGEEAINVSWDVFKQCPSLKTLEFKGAPVNFENYVFTMSGLEKVYLPDCVKSLGIHVFMDCKLLKKVTFPTTLTAIGQGMLFGCTELEQVIIPEGVKTLGAGIISAADNPSVRLISLPSTLESFYPNVYKSFNGLPTNVEILCWAKNPPTGADDFTGNTVHVPVGCASIYKTGRCWQGANIIDDLVVDRELVTDGTKIRLTVPVNNGISEDAQIDLWMIDCYKAGEDTPCATYEFNAKGQPMTSNAQAMRSPAAGSLTLTLDNLEPESSYTYNIKGYTADKDVVYSDEGSFVTKMDDVDSIICEDSVIGDIFTLSGHLFKSNPTAEDVKNLPAGIYIIGTKKILVR